MNKSGGYYRIRVLQIFVAATLALFALASSEAAVRSVVSTQAGPKGLIEVQVQGPDVKLLFDFINGPKLWKPKQSGAIRCELPRGSEGHTCSFAIRKGGRIEPHGNRTPTKTLSAENGITGDATIAPERPDIVGSNYIRIEVSGASAAAIFDSLKDVKQRRSWQMTPYMDFAENKNKLGEAVYCNQVLAEPGADDEATTRCEFYISRDALALDPRKGNFLIGDLFR